VAQEKIVVISLKEILLELWDTSGSIVRVGEFGCWNAWQLFFIVEHVQSCMKVFPGQYPLWVYMEGSSCNTPLKGGKYLSIIHLCLVHEEEIKIQQATGELYMVILLDPILLEHYRRSHHALGRHRSISCKPIFDLMWISNKRHLVRYDYYCHTSRQQ